MTSDVTSFADDRARLDVRCDRDTGFESQIVAKRCPMTGESGRDIPGMSTGDGGGPLAKPESFLRYPSVLD